MIRAYSRSQRADRGGQFGRLKEAVVITGYPNGDLSGRHIPKEKTMDTGLSGIPDPLAAKAEEAFTNVKGALFALFDGNSSEQLALPIQVLVADQLSNVLEQARMGNPLGTITENVRSGNAPLALGAGPSTPAATAGNDEDELIANTLRHLARTHNVPVDSLLRTIENILSPLSGLSDTEVNARLNGMVSIADGTTAVENDGTPVDNYSQADLDAVRAERDTQRQKYADLVDDLQNKGVKLNPDGTANVPATDAALQAERDKLSDERDEVLDVLRNKQHGVKVPRVKPYVNVQDLPDTLTDDI